MRQHRSARWWWYLYENRSPEMTIPCRLARMPLTNRLVPIEPPISGAVRPAGAANRDPLGGIRQ